LRSGYRLKSVCAAAAGAHSAAKVAIALSKLRSCMTFLPGIDLHTRKAKAVRQKRAAG
jgi:hypothetical protein